MRINPVNFRYWNDPEMMSKLGKAMGGTFDFAGMLGGAPGIATDGDTGTERATEEEEAEEETLHGAASAGG